MKPSLRRVLFGVGPALLFGVLVASSAADADPSTRRVSVQSGGGQSAGSTGFVSPAVSADGRYVAFRSTAANLVVGDTNGLADVFVHDNQTGDTTRVSVQTSSGLQATVGESGIDNPGNISISGDGRYVAFSSLAALSPGDFDANTDVYVHDRTTGITERVSVNSAEVDTPQVSHEPSITADGRHVAFVSFATKAQWGHNDVNNGGDVFVRDLLAGTTTLVSVTPAGTTNPTGASAPAISADGNSVAFRSNGMYGDITPDMDIYVRDLIPGTTAIVSLDSAGVQAPGSGADVDINGDGSVVTFRHSGALVPGDVGRWDTYVRDRVAGTTVRASVTSAGLGGSSDSHDQTISGNGRYVAFSTGSRLAPTDVNGSASDVYVRDLVAETTAKMSNDGDGLSSGSFASSEAVISDDGSAVAFRSDRPSLVPGDTNNRDDVFIQPYIVAPTDSSPPVISHTLNPPVPDGQAGWYRSDVALTWQVTDDESTVTETGCDDQNLTVDQAAISYSCGASSDGGTAGPVEVVIARDATAPEVTATATPAAADGIGGWYRTTPIVTFYCVDATSGMATCPEPVPVTGGAVQQVAATATDVAGNEGSVSVGPFNVDVTVPEVVCATAPTFEIREAHAAVAATVTDTLSGPAMGTVSAPADTSNAGANMVQLTAGDVAGHTTTATCGYHVEYGFSGFQSPVDPDAVNVAKAGSTVPLRWRVIDHAGNPVDMLAAAAVSSAAHNCAAGAIEDPVEEEAAGNSGLQNLGDGYYQFNWKTPKGYTGGCRTLIVDLGDGIARTAEFRFKS